MEKVMFFCKLNKKGQVVIHSICRDTKSNKSCFAIADRLLQHHPVGIRKKVLAEKVKSKRHVKYTLSGDEVFIYLNPLNGQFWFKGKQLDVKAAQDVTKEPSFEEDEPIAGGSGVASRSGASSVVIRPNLKRQFATVKRPLPLHNVRQSVCNLKRLRRRSWSLKPFWKKQS